MVTQYPGKIDNNTSLPDAVDNLTPVKADVVNRLKQAIIAIENELGTKPSGIYSTLKARLTGIEDSFNNLDIIQIAKDIGGTANEPLIVGLQGVPLSSATPDSGEVLAFNGLVWVPTTLSGPPGSFAAGGDLSGNTISQTVVGLQGSPVSDIAPVDGYVLTWDTNEWVPKILEQTGLAVKDEDISVDTNTTTINFTGSGIQATQTSPGVVAVSVAAAATGWQTALDLDFTTQATQNLSTNGNKTIGGLTWSRQNAANDRVAMALTNGTGLVIAPNTSAYTTNTRSGPLLWLALSQLGITDLDWSTQFRIWIFMSDTYEVGFESSSTMFCGIDSNSLNWSPGYMATGVSASPARFIYAGTRFNSTGGAQSKTPGTFSGNASNILRVETSEIGRTLQIVTTDWAPTGSPWPANGAAGFRPTIGTFVSQSAQDLLTYIDNSNVGPGSALGIVLGAQCDNDFVHYVATIKRIRVDYKL